ncbi:MAG: 4-hydroxyacetophenone monooxygenase, partial [Pseudomonadota bacterium]
SLSDRWADGAEAYLGTMTSGFPNLFLLYGPNTNTGHTSVIFKLEQQFALVRKLMTCAQRGTVRVKPEREAAYNTDIQRRLRRTAWDRIDTSWYRDGGKVTNNWPGSSLEFRRRLNRPNLKHFEFAP